MKNLSQLALEIKEFLDENNIEYRIERGLFFLIFSKKYLRPIMLSDEMPDRNNGKELRVYEDLWRTKGQIIKSRIRSISLKGEIIYARQCKVISIERSVEREFLDQNHMLGYTKSKYRYALVYSGRLVAVASFSNFRTIDRGGQLLKSYEWIRYASDGSSRVVGGMGKLLSAFIKEVCPGEIMSYADIDWSQGDSYKRLEFNLLSITKPIRFIVDRGDYSRVKIKTAPDEALNQQRGVEDSRSVLVTNSGNYKFVRIVTPV